MTWEMYRWVWCLESPIHLGIAPAGVVNRTRLYVPAKTIWGALTAEIARREANDKEPLYEEIGQKLQKKVRFTYLYPAEWTGQSWTAWLSSYTKERGFCWCCEDKSRDPLPDRKFRAKLLFSLPGTAIDPSSNTAEESALREMEFICKRWRDGNYECSKVAFVGYVFFNDDSIKEQVLSIEELFIGADTRYGFGRIELVEPPTKAAQCFGEEVILDKSDPWIKTDTVLAHVKAGNVKLMGSFELLQHWDRGKIAISGLAWSPGSFAEKKERFAVLPSGLWEFVSS